MTTGALESRLMGTAAAAGPGPRKLVLLYMPWATTTRPSLALGILDSMCREQDVAVQTLYGNLDVAAAVGFEMANRMANERSLYGLYEHLFSCDVFGADVLSSDEYLEVLSGLEIPESFKDIASLRRLRDDIIPAFLDQLEERVIAAAPSAIGVSATFNQVMPSLAIARRVKLRDPSIQVLAGGACFDGEMGQEYHRALPEVLDHVFMGEAEESFREWLRRHRAAEPTQGIPGVTWWEEGEVRLLPGRALPDVNDSPMPSYDDFFEEKQRVHDATGLVFNVERLPFESSRGCWWGQKNHCISCGINNQLMGFREKDVDRVLSEMINLAARYRVVKLTAADWIISRRSRAEIFRRLEELDVDIECFYETRADLAKEEVKLMKDAGIVNIQPGIESLSTELLRLMRKGTTRIRHVQFLRWAREYGLNLSYNILAGFPGEKAAWYHEMAEFLPTVVHLQPPLHNMHWVEMHRFSPLFQRREEFGVDDFQLRHDYCFNFPEGMVDPLKVGYFFSFNADTLEAPELYTETVRKVIGDWIERHRQPRAPIFEYELGPGFMHVTDTRVGEGRYLDLADLHQDVMLLCDEVRSVDQLRSDLAQVWPEQVHNGGLESVVDELVSQGLLMREGKALLSLPIASKPRTTAELRAYVLGDAVRSDAA